MSTAEPNSPITETDISEYLDSTDDFAFEREVYHVANGLKFEAAHAALYIDPITAKPRQFDVRASFTLQQDKISLAIECKTIGLDFPLLVSCVPRATGEAFHEHLFADDTMGAGSSFTRVRRVPSVHEPRLYPAGQGVGKSMRQVRRDRSRGKEKGAMVGGDEVFDKWMQSLASIAEMVEIGAGQLEMGRRQPLLRLALIPVLVVSDGALWIADYASNGKLQRSPFQHDAVTFYLGRKYELEKEQTTFTVTHLHVMTRSTIRQWLKEIADGGGIWNELFPGHQA